MVIGVLSALVVIVLGYVYFADPELHSKSGPTTNASQPVAEAPKLVRYHILRDESFDESINSAAKLRCVLDSPLTVANVDSALHELYASVKARSFKYHPDDFGISVFLYSDEARAQGASMGWVGRAYRQGGSAQDPQFDVKGDAINAINEPPKTVFNLTEKQRKQLIWDVGECQNKSLDRAQKKYPNNLDKQAEMSNASDEACVDRTIKKYRVSKSAYFSIEEESVKKNWPTPDPPN